MGAVVKQETCDISVLATELFALKTSLQFALDSSFHPLILESDRLETVNLFNKQKYFFVVDNIIVSEIQDILS